MDVQEIMSRDLATLQTSGQAREVIFAVLETLGERLSKAEREQCAGQLPNELK